MFCTSSLLAGLAFSNTVLDWILCRDRHCYRCEGVYSRVKCSKVYVMFITEGKGVVYRDLSNKMLFKSGFHIVVIVVIQSAIVADQVLQQLRLVIIVILSAINRRLLKKLNQVQLVHQLQQSPIKQHLMEISVADCLRQKSHMMLITNERQKLLFTSRVYKTTATG